MGEKESYSESSKEGASLRRALELISSLISLSHSVKVFAGKWQSIRSKLDELHSGLTAVENCNSGGNPLLSAAVVTINATLGECSDNARRCVDLSYSGKLLMQSDLDIVSTKLENHIGNLSEIYNMGLLWHNAAIVVSKPGPTACRDDMRFYAGDLMSRLKIGGSDMKKQTLFSLNEIIHEDDRYVKIVVEIESFVSVLVGFLDSQEPEIQEEAAKAVSVIAGFQYHRGLLIGAGVIGPLIRVLECGSVTDKELAARCLQKLTENSDNAWSISAHGGVTALLKTCSNPDSGGELVNLVVGVLKNLVGVEEIRRFMIEEGAISQFIKLANSRDELTQISSIDFLQSMAAVDESIRRIIVEDGGIRVLTSILDPKSPSSSKTRELASRTILNLCSSPPDSAALLRNSGYTDHILHYLRNGDFSIQETALKAALWLSGSPETTKTAMGEAGFMPEIAKFLDSNSYEVRETAALALSNLIVVPRNRKKFAKHDQNLVLIMKKLDPEETNSGHRKLLLSILVVLINCNSARKKIMSSKYMKNIHKLAEDEVSDAKKIVRRLSSNRFKSMFRGIWNS